MTRQPDERDSGTGVPELWIFFFALLLNFPWEFLQVPLFADVRQMPHWQGVEICSQAALGDAGIALFAFSLTAGIRRNRRWLMGAAPAAWAIYLATGLVATVLFEELATGVLGRWRYAAGMPVLPVVGTGITPILQWLLLPPLVLLLARGQLRGSSRS